MACLVKQLRLKDYSPYIFFSNVYKSINNNDNNNDDDNNNNDNNRNFLFPTNTTLHDDTHHSQ